MGKGNLFRASALILIQTLLMQASAHAYTSLLENNSGMKRSQAEYFNLNADQRLSIKVNVVGGFMVPGLYHIPDNVHLLDLISLAGGPALGADLGKVFIKRQTENGYKILEYDVNEIMSKPDVSFPMMKDRDSVYSEVKTQSTGWLTILTGVTLFLSIFTTGTYIYSTLKNTH